MNILKNILKPQKVEGKIAYHDLIDWWLSTFTETEREYIENRYQPMNASPKILTRGTVYKEEGEPIDTGMFLYGLATWFRSKSDASIFKRIHEKIDELGHTHPLSGAGYVRGRLYVTYVYDVENLKSLGKLEEAEKLLLELINATEEQDKERNLGVGPWYYEELAKIYRKSKNFTQEVFILERYARQVHGGGVKPPKLLERLEKAKLLLNKSEASNT
jgi:hypothetical protein